MTEAIWLDVPGYEGRYRISDQGEVASIPRRRATGGVLSTAVVSGYVRVSLQNGAKRRRAFLVHRLVLTTFVGPCPPGHEAAHLNGLSTDNRLSNLQWATKKENCRHRELHGTVVRGERSPSSKLSWEKVETIRALHGVRPQAELAARFNVSRSAIQRVQGGFTWALK